MVPTPIVGRSKGVTTLTITSTLLFLVTLHFPPATATATPRWSSPWHFLGPFSVGKTEIDGDPLCAPHLNLTSTADPPNYNVPPPGQLFSEMVTSGEITSWSPLKANTKGFIQVEPSTMTAAVNLNHLVRLSSSITIQEFQGLLSRTFVVAKAATHALSCVGLHSIEIDTILYHADIYASQQIFAVVHLTAGTHHVSSRIRAKGSAQFRCQFTATATTATGAAMFPPPEQEIPDIVNGTLLTPYIALRISNLRTIPISHWKFTTNNKDIKVIVPLRSQKMKCYPGQSLALPVKIELNLHSKQLKKRVHPKGSGEKKHCLPFTLTLHQKNQLVSTVSMSFRCRRVDQSQLMTFISHDGTVASAAFLRPRDPLNCRQTQGGCPVVLALSGVGVQPTNMADAFKYKTSPTDVDYMFGLPAAFILAPERDGAHNFENTGHRTAMSALRALKAIFPVDQMDLSRIVYAGHSRGGHGALVFATHRPDSACGVFSSNGWTGREYYADANPIFDHDVQLSHADATVIRRVFESSISENDVSLSASNMVGLPTLLRTSSDDTSVSPWFIRRFARILTTLENDQSGTKATKATAATAAADGSTVEFNEFTGGGKGHWWWNSETTNDGGVMFDPKVRRFVVDSLHRCRHRRRNQKNTPHAFQVISLNPSTFSSHRGIRIQQFQVPFRVAAIDVVQKENHSLAMKTSNVRRFSLMPWHVAQQIIVDGQPIELPRTKERKSKFNSQLHFLRTEDSLLAVKWVATTTFSTTKNATSNATPQRQHVERRPGTTGPMRQVFDRPFIIIPNGTATLALAVLLANSHFAGSKSTAPIYFPRDVDEGMKKNFNLIFIGKSDLRDEMVMDHLPIGFPIQQVGKGGFQIHHCIFQPGDRAGVVFLAPTKTVDNDLQLALVIDATDAVDLVDLFRGSYSSNVPLTRAMFTNMYPDFMVTNGKEFRWKGYGGLHMSGYFGWNWGWDDSMSVVSSSCHNTLGNF